jgi:hypothetical protein
MNPPVAGEIKNQHRRRLFRGFGLFLRDIPPVRDDEVVVRIRAHAACASDDPAFRQRFGQHGSI